MATSTKHPFMADYPMTLPRPWSGVVTYGYQSPDRSLGGLGNRIGAVPCLTTTRADCHRPYATRSNFDQKFRFQTNLGIEFMELIAFGEFGVGGRENSRS